MPWCRIALFMFLGTCVVLGTPAGEGVAQVEEPDSLVIDRPRFPTTPT